MSGTEETKVKLGADTQEVNEKIPAAGAKIEGVLERLVATFQRTSAESVAATRSMQSQISGHFSQVGAAVNKLTGIVVAITGIVAGGKAFKEVATETMKWTGEAVKLSKALGISTQEASVLNIALGDTYNSLDTVSTATNMITRSLRGNEDAFKRLGVETRDQNGNYRNSLDLMNDVNDRLRNIKEGTDRNVAGMSIYSRGWNEVKGLLRLNAEAMEEARKKAEELHLVVGPEAVKLLKQYKAAQNDIGDILLSLKVQIGNAVLPALVRLGAWFGSIGPEAIEIFLGALNGVLTFVIYLGVGVVTIYETIKTVFRLIATSATTLAEVFTRVMKGDFQGAWAAAKAGASEAGGEIVSGIEKIGKTADKANDAVLKLWGLRKSNLPEAKTGDDNADRFDGAKKEEPKSRVPAWKSELDEMKLADDAFLASSLADDLAFWEAKKKNLHMTAEEERAVNHEILVLRKNLQRENLQSDIEGIKIRIDQEKRGSESRVQIWDEAVRKIAAAYGRDSREYKEAIREREKLARDHADLLVHLADLVTEKNRELARIGIEIERDRAAFLRESGAITAEEEILRLKALEQRKAAIERAALDERLSREYQGTVEYQKTLNEIETSQAKHNQVMSQLDRKLAQEQSRTFDSVYSSMERSFSSAIQGMIIQGSTFQQAMKQIGAAVLGNVVDLCVKMLFEWTKREIMKTALTRTQEGVRTAITSTGESARSSLAVAGATTQISANAAAAGAGAAASQAPIPIIGPILAAVAMGSMLALVMGLSSKIASASGGWGQIPEDQVAQVHKDEMILPAELADGVRQSIGRGSAGGSGGSGGNTFNISAVDAKSVRRLIKNEGGAVADAMARQARNFRPLKSSGRG